jgi:hypothetical protein
MVNHGNSGRAKKMAARRKEMRMHTHGHTTVWEPPIDVSRASETKSWYQQLRDRCTARKAACQQAHLDALHRCWDGTREAVTPHRAEAAPEMAAVHHAISVATMLYGLSQ